MKHSLVCNNVPTGKRKKYNTEVLLLRMKASETQTFTTRKDEKSSTAMRPGKYLEVLFLRKKARRKLLQQNKGQEITYRYADCFATRQIPPLM